MGNETKNRWLKQEFVSTKGGKRVLVSTTNLSGPFENGYELNLSVFRATGGHIETTVFPADANDVVTDWGGLDCRRTTRESEWEAQHRAMVEKWTNSYAERES